MQTQREIRGRLAYLLGFIILMEEKIEVLKQELAGHDEFDSRVAFLLLDTRNRGYISLTDLNPIVSGLGSGLSLDSRSPHELSSFFKRYGNGEKLTYNEFLREIRPKMNIQLSQSLLVRNIVKKYLPEHIRQRFELLMAYYLLLAAQSERIRLQIQSELGINFVQIYEIVRYDLLSESHIEAFFRQNGDTVAKHQTRYLINHTKDLKDFEEWTEQEFKEIFSPVDSLRRFEEYRPEVAHHTFQQRSVNTQPEFRTAKKDNYLGVKFNHSSYGGGRFNQATQQQQRSAVHNKSKFRENTIVTNKEAQITIPIVHHDKLQRSFQESVVSDQQRLKYDVPRFTIPMESQLDKFIFPPGRHEKAIQFFEDDLNESQKSAFKYY